MKGSNFKYVCKECGHEETKWAGKCPECGSWNSFEEVEAASVSVSNPNTTVIDTTVSKNLFVNRMAFKSFRIFHMRRL